MIGDFSGLIKVVPVYGIVFLIVLLSSMGMPTTNGFIGELFILIGAYKVNVFFAIPVVAGILLGVVYLLWTFQRIFLGTVVKPGKINIKDLSIREKAAMIPIILLIFWIGIYPKPFLAIPDVSLNHLSKMIMRNYKQGARHRILSKYFSKGISKLTEKPLLRVERRVE